MKEKTRARLPGIIVLTCAMIVILWQAMGIITSGPPEDYTFTAEDLDSFELKLDGWKVEQLEVASNSQEMNLLKYRLTPRQGAGSRSRESGDSRQRTVDSENRTTQQLNNLTTDLSDAQLLVRLVHGYNMRDCMRIKGYEVEELDPVAELLSSQVAELGKMERSPADNEQPNNQQPTTDLRRAQVWRLTSGANDTSLWLSSMLRAGDFSEMDLSVTDMAFPRVGIPDDPNWIPRGITFKSLRHPVRNMKYMLRAKWNASRCDPLTFLGLKRRAWGNDDALTLLVVWVGPPLKPEDEAAVSALLADVYHQIRPQLQAWGAERE